MFYINQTFVITDSWHHTLAGGQPEARGGDEAKMCDLQIMQSVACGGGGVVATLCASISSILSSFSWSRVELTLAGGQVMPAPV